MLSSGHLQRYQVCCLHRAQEACQSPAHKLQQESGKIHAKSAGYFNHDRITLLRFASFSTFGSARII